MKFIVFIVVVIVAALLVATSFFPSEPDSVSYNEEQNAVTAAVRMPIGGPIQPIQHVTGLNDAKVALGAQLFNETALSDDGTISCASCHRLDLGGTNGLPMSIGIGGRIEQINVPTVFNASLNFAQFWDGRASTLEEQITGPIENPLEMGTNWPDVLQRLRAMPAYAKQFSSIYPDGLTVETVSNAIAAFERSLVTPDSPFDQYLNGNQEALSQDARDGYELFQNLGCVRCHQGQGIGGNMFQRMGAKQDYFANRTDLTVHDLGRFNVTGDEFDKYRFKVPSLRNIALTAPYFHDGSAATLEDAIQTMAKYQLGRRLKDREEHLLVSFLSSLTGEYQGQPLGAQAQGTKP